MDQLINVILAIDNAHAALCGYTELCVDQASMGMRCICPTIPFPLFGVSMVYMTP